MPRLRGTGLGTGMALGTTAVIREQNGIPVPPAVPNRIAIALATRRTSELPDVVLVAREYSTALALASSISWARVVAIAAESAPADAPVPPFPAVVNVPDLVASVQDDVLFLVDAGSNFVFPDPDPMFLAQYTAEHERIAPKRRFYLDEGHAPAHTVDGQTVQVFALVSGDLDEVSTAIGQGADGLLLPYDSALHSAPEEPQRKLLFDIIHQAAGKPLIIADIYKLPAALLCEAAVEADLTVAVPPADQSGIPKLAKELERTENSCFDNDIPASVPRLAALVPTLSHEVTEPDIVERWVEEVAASGAARVIFSMDHDTLSEGVLVELEVYLSACARNTLPTYVSLCRFAFNTFGQNALENSFETAVRLLVGSAATGIIVPHDMSGAAKKQICELDSEECREEYWRVLNEARLG